MFSGKFQASICRRWLVRIALAGWVIYAIGILLFPLWDEAKERNRAFVRDSGAYDICKSAAAEHKVPQKLSNCENVYQARLERDTETYRFGSEYRAMGWRQAWVVLAALCVPPLIFFVIAFGVIFGFVKVVSWLRRGLDSQWHRGETAPARQAF